MSRDAERWRSYYPYVMPQERALREQVDWARVRREVGTNDFAVVFLQLLDRLEIVAAVSAA